MSSAIKLNWVAEELATLLQLPQSDDIARYILSIENHRDLEDYLSEILDTTQQEHRNFISNLLQHHNPIPSPTSGLTIYKKKSDGEDYVSRKQVGKKNQKDTHETRGKPETKVHTVVEEAGKKTKFVPLFCRDGDAKTVQLSGRHRCDCQAAKHKLINNCLKCGRVVCQQEGSGPCVFCGSMVCTREEEEVLARNSRKSQQLLRHLMEGDVTIECQVEEKDQPSLARTIRRQTEGLENAISNKNKLLEFDRTSKRRTRVIDDESDYFSTGSQWSCLAERQKREEREQLAREQRHKSRLNRKFTFDFAGRRMIDEEESSANLYCEQDTDSCNANTIMDLVVNPNLKAERPLFQETHVGFPPAWTLRESCSIPNRPMRLQDRELQQMSDQGFCLSMHQPWASLLIKGIKLHEGRTWYSAHRGRLWIATAAKIPTEEEIREVEVMTRLLLGDKMVKFPDQYPTGCLLGCVDVTDCVSQEEYRQRYPQGESSSPYVFICENPQELIARFPVKGQHKIYKLEPNIHQAAKKTVKRTPEPA